MSIARAIARRDDRVPSWLAASPELARTALSVGGTRATQAEFFLTDVTHQVYAGDTLLHVAAAACAIDVARRLIDAGADVRARNRRGAEPLHYAADGGPSHPTWDPPGQAAMVTLLITAAPIRTRWTRAVSRRFIGRCGRGAPARCGRCSRAGRTGACETRTGRRRSRSREERPAAGGAGKKSQSESRR
jgi:hypothetical protein